MKQKFFLLFVLFLPFLSTSQTITVKQDSTGDFITIQAAIDSASNGDTILVWPGNYYENVQITEKSLVLGSLTLTTGDGSYKYQTIIDGNHSGSCIVVKLFSNVVIDGITCQHGTGSYDGYISGGGIFIEGSTCKVFNTIVINNKCNGYGGGIYSYFSDTYLSNVTITNNHAYDRGGGILLLKGSLTFDTLNRCNIYENYAAVGSDFYKMGSPDSVYFVVDTFTVQNPDYYYAFSKDDNELPQNDIVFNILHHKIEQDSTDLYVAPWGDNTNSGLASGQPLKTISYALLKMASDSVSPDTIHVANGTYSDTLIGEHFPLSLKSYVTIEGQSRDSTILDAEDKIYHANGIPSASHFNLINFTLKRSNGDKNNSSGRGSLRVGINSNIEFKNLLFTNNKGSYNSCCSFSRVNNCFLTNSEFCNNEGRETIIIAHASIFPVYDTIYITNCKMKNNKGTTINYGRALHIVGMNADSPIFTTGVLINTLITDYETDNYADKILIWNGSELYIVNSTITNNISETTGGGNIGVTYNGRLKIYNSIIYNNTPVELYMANFSPPSPANYLNIYHSLIDGGESGIRILTGNNVLYYDTTNIDTDPLFYGGPDFPYNLSDESPCIDAGTLDLPQFILDHMTDVDLAGNPRIVNDKIDMGCYEWNPTVGTEEHPTPNTELRTPNLKVFPNPFSTTTYIAAQWKESSIINIEVYNNAGLLVKTLQSGKQLPGSCKISWDGTDDIGNGLPSGIYYVVLRIDSKEVVSIKIIKL